ncbi:MAG: LysE family transporter [Alphaproteobacteria bacterium]|nr:LysE family transporter [Alphaproteobacteria bacterium]
MKLFLSGLKFGMLLQIAVGPMCLMVFNTAKNTGFLTALSLILAITLVDALYITLAGLGVSKLLKGQKRTKILKMIGAFVLVFFGLSIILNVVGINVVPGLNLTPTATSIFVQGLILTLSNPLTIVFWTSVLVDKIIEDKLKNKQLIIFSFGLVSATLLFLSGVAILGRTLSTFIPAMISDVLNIAVGLLIIFFGIRLFVRH